MHTKCNESKNDKYIFGPPHHVRVVVITLANAQRTTFPGRTKHHDGNYNFLLLGASWKIHFSHNTSSLFFFFLVESHAHNCYPKRVRDCLLVFFFLYAHYRSSQSLYWQFFFSFSVCFSLKTQQMRCILFDASATTFSQRMTADGWRAKLKKPLFVALWRRCFPCSLNGCCGSRIAPRRRFWRMRCLAARNSVTPQHNESFIHFSCRHWADFRDCVGENDCLPLCWWEKYIG